MTEDKADIVEIEIHPFKLQFSNQTYPEPTRETILNAAREYLEQTIFSYSEKRITHKEESVSEQLMNDLEPIPSTLETFGDVQDALDIHNELVSGKLLGDLPQSHTEKIFTTRQTIGRASKEQGGNRDSISYNTERDPFNE